MSAPRRPRPANISQVRRPKWTGADGEVAIMVAPGEPRRTVAQMTEGVAYQVIDYCTGFVVPYPPDPVVEHTIELIVRDKVHDHGPGFWLTREHLLAYIEVAAGRAPDLATRPATETTP